MVKGVNFVDIRDAGDPVERGAFYNDEGADELVFLDITASHERRETAAELAERVAKRIFVPFTVGGGIRTVEQMREVVMAGADKVSLNTAAVADPGLISQCAERFGAQAVVVAIDARQEGDAWTVTTHGGRTPAGRDAVEWAAEAVRRGAGEILLTSMDRDGTRDGYDLPLLKAVCAAVDVPVIASGGAGNAAHMVAAIKHGADAVLLAGILHDGEAKISDLKAEMAQAGVPVRNQFGALSS